MNNSQQITSWNDSILDWSKEENKNYSRNYDWRRIKSDEFNL